MKGLLIKDFFCLKKQLINYGFIIAGVIVISVMFVLSYNFGNIHAGFTEMVDSGQNTGESITMIASNAMLLFMLIPIACTGDITNLVIEDEKASFYKVASALPVSVDRRVACRFMAGYLFIVLGAAVDLILSVILSSLTDVISLEKYCGVIITFASVMMMYISLFILFTYILGKGKTTYANILPLLIGLLVCICISFNKIKAFLTDTDDNALIDLYNRTTDFMFYRSYILLIAAIIISGSTYFAAVYIAKRKRGVA